MFQADDRVLFIGAHPDDIEIGAGGTVHRLTSAGVAVHLLILTYGTHRLSPGFREFSERISAGATAESAGSAAYDPGSRHGESIAAAACLGVPESRVFVATDAGLLDYQYAPAGANPDATWILRGQLIRWSSVRGLRLQTDAQQDEGTDEVKAVWRLVSEDPKMELTVSSDDGEKAIEALASFARACLQHAG